MPPATKRKMRTLLTMKVTSAKIAAMLGVPADCVRSLRRLDRYREPVDDAPASSQKRVCEFSQENFMSLLRVANDLIDLGDLLLITNPLFYHLTQRAEKVFNGKEEENSGN
jgi:hypothetical protein